MRKKAEQLLNAMKIGESKDWKFGLITREIYRKSEHRFEINDTSDGWQQVTVSKETMVKLLSGEKSLLTLNWK